MNFQKIRHVRVFELIVVEVTDAKLLFLLPLPLNTEDRLGMGLNVSEKLELMERRFVGGEFTTLSIWLRKERFSFCSLNNTAER